MTPSYFANTESLTLDAGRIYVISGKDITEVMSLLEDAKDTIEGNGGNALVYDSRYARSYFLETMLPTRLGVSQGYARAYNAFSYDSVAPTELFTIRGPNADAPVINSISPSTGPNAGGTTVTISGENMANVVLVTFDGAAASIVSTSETSVVVQTPAKLADGGVNIDVITGEGQAVLYEHSSLTLGDFVILVGNQFDPDDKRQNFLGSGLIVDVMLDLFAATSVLGIKSSNSQRYGFTRELWPFVSKVYFFDVDGDDITLVKADQTPERPPFISSPSISVSVPDSSTSVEPGDKIEIVWRTSDIPVGVDVKVELFKGGVLYYAITPVGSGLGYNTPNNGSLLWQVNEAVAGSDYQVKISTVQAPLVSAFSSAFSIA